MKLLPLRTSVRKHTSIPVPKVIAYSSNAENKLRFEWVLLEKIQGSCLYDVWDEMPFDSKVDLTVRMAGLVRQLHDLSFTRIGSLYFSTIADKVNSKTDGVCGNEVDKDIGNAFVIGRVVSPWFFRDKRVWLPGDRGPFASSHDLMLAEMEIQIERVKNLSPSRTDEYFSETDEELAEDKEAVLETCYKLKDLVPTIFPTLDTLSEKKKLCHNDLSGGNIIVDPISYRITGLIDWESVGIRPAWEVSDYPFFLKGIEVQEPPPVGTPGIDESGLIEIRKDWEKVLLRRVHEQSMQGAIDEAISESDKGIMLKRNFARKLAEIEMRWTAARYWMNHLDPSQPSSE